MFRRGPDSRVECPACGKRVDERETRYCNHCDEDITGIRSGPSVTAAIGQSAPSTFAGMLARHEGRYIAVNVRKPEKFERVLLIGVRDDFISLSTARALQHYPMSAVVSVLETGKRAVVVMHHEFIPKSAGGWWLGVEVPIG